MPESYYELLGIPASASRSEIRKAFIKRSREGHPDFGGDEELYKLITVAYTTLYDPDLRAAFDNGTHSHNQPAVAASYTYDGSGPVPKRTRTRKPSSRFMPPQPSFKVTRQNLTIRVDSSDTVVDPAAGPPKFVWFWGDGSSTTTAEHVLSHSYPCGHSFELNLTVSTADVSGEISQHVVVFPSPKVIDFEERVTDLTVKISKVLEPRGSQARLTFDWDDGSALSMTARTHTYDRAGTYDVTVTATNPDGIEASFTKPVEVRGASFLWMGVFHTSGETLARQMQNEWPATRRLLNTRLAELKSWVQRNQFVRTLDAIRVCESYYPPFAQDRVLAQIISALDPTLPPVFCGVDVSPQGLEELAAHALSPDGDSDLVIIEKLLESKSLHAFAGVQGCEEYAQLADDWDINWAALSQLLDGCPSLRPDIRSILEPGPVDAARLLEVLLSEDSLRNLEREIDWLRFWDVSSQAWYTRLRKVEVPGNQDAIGPGWMILKAGRLAATRHARLSRAAENVLSQEAEFSSTYSRAQSIDYEASRLISVLRDIPRLTPLAIDANQLESVYSVGVQMRVARHRLDEISKYSVRASAVEQGSIDFSVKNAPARREFYGVLPGSPPPVPKTTISPAPFYFLAASLLGIWIANTMGSSRYEQNPNNISGLLVPAILLIPSVLGGLASVWMLFDQISSEATRRRANTRQRYISALKAYKDRKSVYEQMLNVWQRNEIERLGQVARAEDNQEMAARRKMEFDYLATQADRAIAVIDESSKMLLHFTQLLDADK